MAAPRPHQAVAPLPARAELFRLFGDDGRLQVLALCAEEELSVGELSVLLKDSQPQMSRKVAALKAASLLDARRDGTRTLVKAVADALLDPVVAEAIAAGRALCLKDGSLARMPRLLAQREEGGQKLFDEVSPQQAPPQPEHLGHLAALQLLLPGRELAVDVGTGDGLTLDVLAPLYERVIAVDRSRAQLARVAERVAARGFHHVSLFPGSYDDAALLQRVDAAGGADLVFAGRTLHHASRPLQALQAFGRLLKRGGHLVVLDYLPHADEAMRAEGGDVWLGFQADELNALIAEAGLSLVGHFPIPPAFHVAGPDAALDWHAWVARRPLPTVTPLSVSNVSSPRS